MSPFISPYLLVMVSVALAGASHVWSAESPAKDAAATQFAPYEFLIGEWDLKATDDGPAVAIIRVKWGPNRSYIWYTSTLVFGGEEMPHLEGMLVWNGVHKNLDMLFCMDLKTGKVQEQGTMSAQPDGTIVRDITATYAAGSRGMGMPATAGPEGATAHFRETYQKISPDKIVTSAMRETKDGWVATFPGSDHLIMTRRLA